MLASRKRFRDKNPSYFKLYKQKLVEIQPNYYAVSRLKCDYGLTENEYVALFVAQGGECAICHAEAPLWGKDRLNIDHDHSTGVVRGLLCWQCNTALGKFYDDPDRLSAAIEYLRGKKP